MVRDKNKNSFNGKISVDSEGLTPPEIRETEPIAIAIASNPMARKAARQVTSTETSTRYYISPDGRAVLLPSGAKAAHFTFGGKWGVPPKGTLEGFELADGTRYFAEIEGYTNASFVGYRKISKPFCPEKDYYESIFVKGIVGKQPAIYVDEWKEKKDCGPLERGFSYDFQPATGGLLIEIKQPVEGDEIPGSKSSWKDKTKCEDNRILVEKGQLKVNVEGFSEAKKQEFQKLVDGLNEQFGSKVKLSISVINAEDEEKLQQQGSEKQLEKREKFEFDGSYVYTFISFNNGEVLGQCEKDYINEKLKTLQGTAYYNKLSDPYKKLTTTAGYVYHAFFAMLKCSVAKDKYYTCTDQNDPATCTLTRSGTEAEAFMAGFASSLIDDFDLVSNIESIAEMLHKLLTTVPEGVLKSYLTYPKDLYDVYTDLKNANDISDALTPSLMLKAMPPPKPTKAQVQFVGNAVSFMWKNYVTDANYWTSGELTAMVGPIILTGGAYLAAKTPALVGRVSKLFAKADDLADFFKAGKKLEHVDIPNGTAGDIKQIAKRNADESIENIYEESPKGSGNYSKICGSCLALNTAVFGTNATLESLKPLTSVQTLEKDGSIGTRNVWGKVGRKVSEVTRIWIKGETVESTTDHDFIAKAGKIVASSIRKGTLLFSLALGTWLPVDSVATISQPTQVEGLMLEGVEAYGVGILGIATAPSNGWCVKGLDLVGHKKFNDWATKYKSTLKFGAKVGDDAASAITEALSKKLDDLGVNKTKTIIETLEDSQGRMTFVIKTDGVTHDLVTIQKNIDGDNVVQSYNRAYNPSANTSYPVPASANRLVPDFDGTSYIFESCQEVINKIKGQGGKGIKIKMTKGNRPADYSAANEIMKQYNPSYASIPLGNNKAPSGFTWHHLDDLEIDANGDAWCTMQLVDFDVHKAEGMRHSGAVAQLDRYNKVEIDLTEND